MTISAKTIAGTAVGLGSLGLLGHSISLIPKKFSSGKDSTKRMIKGGVGLLAGIGLLGAASQAQQSL